MEFCNNCEFMQSVKTKERKPQKQEFSCKLVMFFNPGQWPNIVKGNDGGFLFIQPDWCKRREKELFELMYKEEKRMKDEKNNGN